MHKWQASNFHSKIFHGYTSYIMILEMAAWGLQCTLSNSQNMQRRAEQQQPMVQPPTSAPGSQVL